ncbi:AMP-binding enzyme [Frankia sp. Cas3]|uniref:AMP-binding enzyme n=1 Tax=Frankia sp. Cas3 TaxID=3073926 RepID=UPI002AD3C42B|nr:hypothetical protein [Frankia sp. Cas3]
MSYSDVEAELRRHPAVQECVVARIPTGPRTHMLVAYVVIIGQASPADIRAFLSTPRLRSNRVPRAVIPVDSLPCTRFGEVDRGGLPLPVQPGMMAGGKGALADLDDMPLGGLMLVLAGVVALVAFLTTDVFWPGSTDLSVVPQTWFRRLFTGLYVAEFLSFGLGISFLLFGRRRLTRLGRPSWLTTLAHLSIVWLLAAWWPQDNFYRLAAKTDWARQAALVYGFNITLMIAAAVLVVFAVRERPAG